MMTLTNKTRIEWTDYSTNSIKGKCQRACPYCYAHRMYDDLGWDPTIRFVESELTSLKKVPLGKKVFMCSTHDIFGPWVLNYWIDKIFDAMEQNDLLTFQVLTKYPQRDIHRVIPPNVWMGTTIDSMSQMDNMEALMNTHPTAKICFVSFEPLLEEIKEPIDASIDWVIIGAETGRRAEKVVPKAEWVARLMNSAKDAGIPVFLKNNLNKVFNEAFIKANQKYPEVK